MLLHYVSLCFIWLCLVKCSGIGSGVGEREWGRGELGYNQRISGRATPNSNSGGQMPGAPCCTPMALSCAARAAHFCHCVCEFLSVRWDLLCKCQQVQVPQSSEVHGTHCLLCTCKCSGGGAYKCLTVLGGVHVTVG